MRTPCGVDFTAGRTDGSDPRRVTTTCRATVDAGLDGRRDVRLGRVASRSPEGVLITGVYGSGKSSVAAEIGYELEQRGELYALLDLDFLGWVGDHDTGRDTMLRNLAAIAPSYRDLGVGRYVLAYFVPDRGTLDRIRGALAAPLRVVRLSVPITEIERRLSADVTSGRMDDLRDARPVAGDVGGRRRGRPAHRELRAGAEDRPRGDLLARLAVAERLALIVGADRHSAPVVFRSVVASAVIDYQKVTSRAWPLIARLCRLAASWFPRAHAPQPGRPAGAHLAGGIGLRPGSPAISDASGLVSRSGR